MPCAPAAALAKHFVTPMNNLNVIKWERRGKTREFQRHLAYAIDAIHAAQKHGQGVISWSTGKDSTAMTHLIKVLYPETPIMIQFDDCDWPEKRQYAERVAHAHGWTFHAVEPSFSVWERSLDCNIGFDDVCAQSSSFTQDSFLTVLHEKQQELGANLVYLGLRSEESHARKLNMATRGEVYQLKNGEWRCCPLGRWTAEDVFAYLTMYKVEINPCYFYNKFNPPEKIRLCWALPTPTGIRFGDMQHIRAYYPQQFRRLRDRGIV